MTYAVPGESGPAHVPITPFTVSMPFTGSDSNHSLSRSETLIVNSFVTSPTPRMPSPRVFHATRSCSSRSRTRIDPSRGGPAPGLVPGFKDEGPRSGLGEEPRADQAVVASADDDGVVDVRHVVRSPSRLVLAPILSKFERSVKPQRAVPRVDIAAQPRRVG